MRSSEPPRGLHVDPPPFRSHTLDVGGGHRLSVRESGRPDGIAAVVLHGGPGSGCSPLLRRFFDPTRYRIVCIDQRGAGESRPRGAISDNTTAHLLRDLRAVRTTL
ncbi:MAG TPA: alpha/beta fold hydrolase, partial [Burkholderiaceae bacterium]|nr:alpha/beta fold hydrolase [Burkholderiaceae bacterium]